MARQPEIIKIFFNPNINKRYAIKQGLPVEGKVQKQAQALDKVILVKSLRMNFSREARYMPAPLEWCVCSELVHCLSSWMSMASCNTFRHIVLALDQSMVSAAAFGSTKRG